MKTPIVTDSACLIGLERIGRLDFLPALFDPIIIPPEVQREFGNPLDWLQVRVPNNQALINALKLVVDDGEAEAIALAYERHNLLILDDRQARSVAQRLTVPIIGTIGVLLLAKQAGILASVSSILIEMESASSMSAML